MPPISLKASGAFSIALLASSWCFAQYHAVPNTISEIQSPLRSMQQADNSLPEVRGEKNNFLTDALIPGEWLRYQQAFAYMPTSAGEIALKQVKGGHSTQLRSDVSVLPNGIYTLTVASGQFKAIEKVIVQK